MDIDIKREARSVSRCRTGLRSRSRSHSHHDVDDLRDVVTLPARLLEGMQTARRCGLQVATHAIGDRGNRLVLEDYARVLGDAARADHCWRVEHAQIVSVADIATFDRLRVIASLQPTHATSDMPWAEARLGRERLAGAYAWRRFLQANVRLALGSDFPVESAASRPVCVRILCCWKPIR